VGLVAQASSRIARVGLLAFKYAVSIQTFFRIWVESFSPSPRATYPLYRDDL